MSLVLGSGASITIASIQVGGTGVTFPVSIQQFRNDTANL